MKIISLEAAPAVYAIQCLRNKRRYIGSAANVRKRAFDHRCLLKRGKHHSVKLQRAWNKYGEEAFAFAVIEYIDYGLVNEREQYWIDHFRSAIGGFNILPSSASRRGFTPSAATRKRMSDAARGRKKAPRSPEHRAALAKANTGKVMSDESRRKMSMARKGVKRRPCSLETRAKISAAHKGRPARLDVLQKAWSATRGRKQSLEEREMRSAIHRARLSRPEERAKRSKAALLGWKRIKDGMEAAP